MIFLSPDNGAFEGYSLIGESPSSCGCAVSGA
jgi:hypothetical protein